MNNDGLTFWERLGRIPAHTLKAQLLYISAFVGVATVFNIFWALVMKSWAPLLFALGGWVFVGAYGLVRVALADRTAGSIGKILVPSGNSTPSVNQHSNIEAMVMRGAYAQAAEAYKAVLATDPADLVACDKLGRLAFQEMKDFQLAVFAYREGEKRAGDARRRAGYALLAAEIYRDHLRDDGRTIVELSRILRLYPDLPNAASLREELAALKARHLEAR